MDFQWLEPFADWLSHHPLWLFVSLAIIAFLESFAIAGILIPGVAIMFTLTVAGASAGIDAMPMLVSAFIGAVLGDGISYWLGWRYRQHILQIYPFNRYPRLITRGQFFFHRYGIISVVLGRFIGPLRAVIPLVAGTMNMSPRLFYGINVLSALAWAPFYLLPGYWVGKSLGTREGLSGHHLLWGLALVGIAWLLAEMARYLDRRHIDNWSRPRWWLAGVGLLTFLVLGFAITEPDQLALNSNTLEYVQAHRRFWLDAVMVFATGIGSFTSSLIIALATSAYLFARKAWITGISYGGLMLCSPVIIFGSKAFFDYSRPAFATQPPGNASFPSGHTTVMTLMVGFMMLTLARTFEGRQTVRVWGIGTGLIGLIAFSRIYLGVHWPTDLLGGFAIGTMVVALFGELRYRLARHFHEAPLAPIPLAVANLAIWTLAYLVAVLPQFEEAARRYSPVAGF